MIIICYGGVALTKGLDRWTDRQMDSIITILPKYFLCKLTKM